MENWLLGLLLVVAVVMIKLQNNRIESGRLLTEGRDAWAI